MSSVYKIVCKLFRWKQNSMESHLKAYYRFMHIGLVQVAVKHLVKRGINAPIFMTLRNKWLKKYKSSLLVVIQTNVFKGLIFFNCFPDLTIYLTCPMTTKALKLDVHVQVDEFHEFKNFIIIFRFSFRLTSTNLNIHYLSPLPSNWHEIVLLQIEDDKPIVFTPKPLKWDEISLTNEHEIPNSIPPTQTKRRDINEIIE